MYYLKVLVLILLLSSVILPVSAFVVSTNDGLQISLIANETMKITIDGINLPQSDLSHSGFFSGRIATAQDQPVHSTFSSQGGQIVETASTNEFTIVSKYTGLDRMIKVDTTITNKLTTDQGRSLVFKLPLNLKGWTWGDDISTSRIIDSSGVYKNSDSIGSEWVITYPLASISSSDGSRGLSIAIPMDQPRVVEIQYLPGEYSILYKFALSNSTARFPNQANFTFYIYKNDLPEWGFRGALKKYYELFPLFFTKRVTREGIWVAFAPTDKITNAEDFGIQFHETWGNDQDSIPYDNSQGIYPLTYTEPWDFYIDMGDYTSQPSYADVLKRIQYMANATPNTYLPGTDIFIEPYKKAAAKACGTSCGYDRAGNYIYTISQDPWNSGSGWAGLMLQNSDPLISSPNGAEAVWKYMINDKFTSWSNKGYHIDGVYFDTFGGLFYGTENYRTDQFSNIPYPLQWSETTNKPVLTDIFTHYMLTEQVASSMHSQGKYTMAMSPNSESAGLFFYHLFDIAGNGGNILSSDEQTMNYRRSLMYQKPYSLLSNDDLSGSSGYDIVEKYFKLCTHYAIFPSMFSTNDYGNNYFANPTLYNRDRPLFKKYIPIIKEIAKAGWEPVTFANTSISGVSLERYGPSAGVTYFSVHNPSLTYSKSFTLTIDKSILSPGSANFSVVELIGNQSINFTTQQKTLSIPVILASADTKVFKIQVENETPIDSITVTAPNGGESWHRGTPHTVTWDYTGSPGSFVKIVVLKSGIEVGTINASTSIGSGGKGSYTWLISSTGSTGTDYRIRVTSVSQPSINDTSDNYFTITPLSFPPLISSFTANTTGGLAPLAVTFNDTSTGSGITAWNWSFDDGTWENATSSTNPVHTYAAGTWYPRLIVTNASGGNTSLITPERTINVIPATPTALTKIGVYKDGTWYLERSGNGAWDSGIDSAYSYGAPGWTPLIGDWNATGKSYVGVTNGQQWYLDWNGNGAWDAGTDKAYSFGTPGWVNVTGNWNHDGKTEIGITNGQQWYLDNNGNGAWDNGIDLAYNFGAPGWIPVVGDWNGTGYSYIGVTNGQQWYLDWNGNGAWDWTVDKTYNFGAPGWTPIVGDWNATGKSNIGVTNGQQWYLDWNGNGTWDGADKTYSFGAPGWTPIVGDWNGDGKIKIGVTNSPQWYLDTTGNGAWENGLDYAYSFGAPGWTSVIGDWNGDTTMTKIGVNEDGFWTRMGTLSGKFLTKV